MHKGHRQQGEFEKTGHAVHERNQIIDVIIEEPRVEINPCDGIARSRWIYY